MQSLTLGQYVVLGGCLFLFAWSVGQLAGSVGTRYAFRYGDSSCVFEALDSRRWLTRAVSVVALLMAIAVFFVLARLTAGAIS